VRRILYTTNAIEALNSKLRRAVRARGAGRQSGRETRVNQDEKAALGL
jgi:transposase-like protein